MRIILLPPIFLVVHLIFQIWIIYLIYVQDKRVMHKLNKQYLLTNAVIFAVASFTIMTITTIALPISDIQAILNNKVGNNNNSTSNNQDVMPMSNQNVLYETKEGKLIYQRVVNVIGYPQIENSIIEHGILRGIGNVTNIQTWINTYRMPNTIYGEGRGIMISADDQMAPWIGCGIGQIQNDGTVLFKDIVIFSNNATGNMKFLDNQLGLSIATLQGNNQTTKIFKW